MINLLREITALARCARYENHGKIIVGEEGGRACVVDQIVKLVIKGTQMSFMWF